MMPLPESCDDGEPNNQSTRHGRADKGTRPTRPRTPRRTLVARVAGAPTSNPDATGVVRTTREFPTQRPRTARRVDCVLLEAL